MKRPTLGSLSTITPELIGSYISETQYEKTFAMEELDRLTSNQRAGEPSSILQLGQVSGTQYNRQESAREGFNCTSIEDLLIPAMRSGGLSR
jgi:hypothetical protein